MDENTRSKGEAIIHEALKLPDGEREEFLARQESTDLCREAELLLGKIESIAAEALILPQEERAEFLASACQGEDFILQETNSIIARREQAEATPEQISGLLFRLSEGDKSALDSLTPLVYNDLRRIANFLLRNERSNHTLQPTALVNEMYIKFARQLKLQWQNRAHFLALAARAMRQILIDYAKYKKRTKHGGEMSFLPLDRVLGRAFNRQVDLIELDDLLKRLAIVDSRKEQVVELRFFGGLSNEEI